jgi:hypothetical protein
LIRKANLYLKVFREDTSLHLLGKVQHNQWVGDWIVSPGNDAYWVSGWFVLMAIWEGAYQNWWREVRVFEPMYRLYSYHRSNFIIGCIEQDMGCLGKEGNIHPQEFLTAFFAMKVALYLHFSTINPCHQKSTYICSLCSPRDVGTSTYISTHCLITSSLQLLFPIPLSGKPLATAHKTE